MKRYAKFQYRGQVEIPALSQVQMSALDAVTGSQSLLSLFGTWTMRMRELDRLKCIQAVVDGDLYPRIARTENT